MNMYRKASGVGEGREACGTEDAAGDGNTDGGVSVAATWYSL